SPILSISYLPPFVVSFVLFVRVEFSRHLRLEWKLVRRRLFVFYRLVPNRVMFLFSDFFDSCFGKNYFVFWVVRFYFEPDCIILLLFEWLVQESEHHFVPNHWLSSWRSFSPTRPLLSQLKC